MAMPSGNVVISDKMQFPIGGGAGSGSVSMEIHHPRPWFPDERDGFISWIRAEFAAANAIIDSLCQHLRVVGEPGEYDYVIGCIQQRRLTWTSVLHMQQYFPISEVIYGLQQAAWRRQSRPVDQVKAGGKEFKRSGVHGFGSRQGQRVDTNVKDSHNLNADSQYFGSNAVVGSMEKRGQVSEGGEDAKFSIEVQNAGEKDVTDTETPDASSKSAKSSKKSSGNSEGTLSDQVESITEELKGATSSLSKGSPNLPVESSLHPDQYHSKEVLAVSPQTFSAVENYDGKLVDVAEGLNLYDKLLNEPEVSKLISLINDLRAAGKRGQFSGQTFVLSKRPMKGHGREMIQLGTAIADAPLEYENASETSKDRKVEPIPALLQDVIDRLVSMQVFPSKPDSCIIDVFNEADHSHPHPWHHWFGRPICVLSLSDCDLVFGRLITADHPGDYRGSLRLSLTPGSLLVLQGRSADVARCAIPSIRKHRILVTLTKSQPRRAVPADGQRLHSSAPQVASWGPPPSRPSSHIRPKQHYPSSMTTAGVLPAPPIRPQVLPPPPNGVLPVFVAAPVATAVTFPAAVPIPPSGSAGWAVAAAPPRHPPPPRLPVPGTGVFLPPPGSGNSSPTQQLSTTPAEASSPLENASSHTEAENGGVTTNHPTKGGSEEVIKTQKRQECNNGSMDEAGGAAAKS